MKETPEDVASISPSNRSNNSALGSEADIHGTTNYTLQRFSKKWFSKDHLDRVLGRPQITAIAFAGTIGIGSFNTSGEMIGISGSLGNTLSFIIAGLIVICVMRSLAELVSVRPVEGALMDYPRQFCDPALGFAVGVIYWATQCISVACLSSGAARIANNFTPYDKLPRATTAGIITGLWLITLFSNLCGVKIYGNLERIVKYIKFLTIIALFILMIIVNLGVGGYPPHNRSINYTHHSFPTGLKFDEFTDEYNVTNNHVGDAGISGSTGVFLAIWTSVTLAIFACQAGDLVVVAAGEAKNPRRDLPPVTRFMYLVPIICYVLLAFVVGFNINYTEPKLYRPWQKTNSTTYPSQSPFVIVLEYTSLAPTVLPRVFDALFLFAAYTAANTALYAASRTLYSFSQEYGPRWMSNTVGKTNRGCTPQTAIIVSSAVGFLAFLGLIDASFNQPIQSLSTFFTSGLSCVYACECFAFLRFKQGLKYLEENQDLSRDDKEYTRDFNYYRAHWQPACAIVGMIGCLLVVCFSGWPSIYIMVNRQKLTASKTSLLKSDVDLAFDLVGSYLAPVLFVLLYLGYKFYFRTTLIDLRDPDIRHLYFLNIQEEPSMPRSRAGIGGWLREIWSFVK